MNELTQKMLDDYKPFIKKSHWDDFVRRILEEVEYNGGIVNIKDVFYSPPYENQISERIYEYASGYCRALEDGRATGDCNGLPLTPYGE